MQYRFSMTVCADTKELAQEQLKKMIAGTARCSGDERFTAVLPESLQDIQDALEQARNQCDEIHWRLEELACEYEDKPGMGELCSHLSDIYSVLQDIDFGIDYDGTCELITDELIAAEWARHERDTEEVGAKPDELPTLVRHTMDKVENHLLAVRDELGSLIPLCQGDARLAKAVGFLRTIHETVDALDCSTESYDELVAEADMGIAVEAGIAVMGRPEDVKLMAEII